MRLFLLTIVLLFVSGCDSTLEPKTELITNQSSSKTFKFLFSDVQRKTLREREVLDAFVNEIQQQTTYPPYTRYEKGGDGIFHIRGVDVKIDYARNAIYVSYLNGREYVYSGDDRVSKVITQINTEFNYTEKNYLLMKASVVPTVEIQKVSTSMEGFELLVNPESAIRDTIQAIENANPSVGRVYERQGELFSKHPATSIFANFITRTERSPQLLSRANLSGTYYSEGIPITIQALPYREGSRLIYSYKIPYSILSNGNATFSKSLVDRIEQQIVSTLTR